MRKHQVNGSAAPVKVRAPVRVRAAVAGSEPSPDLSRPLTGMGSTRGPPIASGGAGVAQCDGLVNADVRRSQRSWKPSQSCLEGIAYASQDLTLAEGEMDQTHATDDGAVMQSCLPCRLPLAQTNSVMYGDCRTLAPTIEGIVGEAQGGTDHVFWFWESVFSAAESDFCHGSSPSREGPGGRVE